LITIGRRPLSPFQAPPQPGGGFRVGAVAITSIDQPRPIPGVLYPPQAWPQRNNRRAISQRFVSSCFAINHDIVGLAMMSFDHTLITRRASVGGHRAEKTDPHPPGISYLRLVRTGSDGSKRFRFPLAATKPCKINSLKKDYKVCLCGAPSQARPGRDSRSNSRRLKRGSKVSYAPIETQARKDARVGSWCGPAPGAGPNANGGQRTGVKVTRLYLSKSAVGSVVVRDQDGIFVKLVQVPERFHAMGLLMTIPGCGSGYHCGGSRQVETVLSGGGRFKVGSSGTEVGAATGSGRCVSAGLC
jgi:hypothetical protein